MVEFLAGWVKLQRRWALLVSVKSHNGAGSGESTLDPSCSRISKRWGWGEGETHLVKTGGLGWRGF